nr:RNA polymerase-associated protein Rtf1-like [Aedes albopictus]
MVKRKSQPIMSSESSSDSEFGSDLDMELMSLAKKKKTSRLASNSPRVEESSDSDSSDDDSEPDASMQCMKRETKQQQQAEEEESGTSSGEDSDDESESSSSSSDSESSEESDDEKMEDVEDRIALNALSGTERVRHQTEPVNKSGINNNEQSEKQEEKVESEKKANQVLSEDESDSSSSDSDDESGSSSSSSSSDSESSEESEDEKMGDAGDQIRLNALSEKEREIDIFESSERHGAEPVIKSELVHEQPEKQEAVLETIANPVLSESESDSSSSNSDSDDESGSSSSGSDSESNDEQDDDRARGSTELSMKQPEIEINSVSKSEMKHEQSEELEERCKPEPTVDQVSSEEESSSSSSDDSSDDESESSSSSDSECDDGNEDKTVAAGLSNVLPVKEREPEALENIEGHVVEPAVNNEVNPKQPDEQAVNNDSEPEEGEVLSEDESSSSSSDDSDSDDSSGSSSSSSDSEFSDGYDDNMMGDEQDRARLNAMSEKDREMEIFERFERHEAMKARWELERKLKVSKKPESTKDEKSQPPQKKIKMDEVKELGQKTQQEEPPKREASHSSSSPESSFDLKERSKERKKNVEAKRIDDKRSNAMAMLKAQRQDKVNEMAQRKPEIKNGLENIAAGKSSQKFKSSNIYIDEWVSDSEDDKKFESYSRLGSSSGCGSDRQSSIDEEMWDFKERKPATISNKEELEKLRISRHKIERFISLPMFNKVVQNCFVRINIGNNNGKPVYRVAEIVGVVETGKVYQFGNCRTNKGFQLKHGNQERVFRMEFISNQDFTDTEYQKWLSACEASGTTLPRVDTVEKKQRAINEAMQYEFNDADIDKIIKEKNKFRANPTNYAMKKMQLMMERDAAQLSGENDLARELNAQIRELEERANNLDRKRSSVISYINNRQRRCNVKDTEKANKENIRTTQSMNIEDPFTRRPTRPRMLFKPSHKENEVPTVYTQAPPPPPPPRRMKKPDEKKPASNVNSNLYFLHDFEINLDVSLPVGAIDILPNPVERPVKTSGPKRSLNLEDFKKSRDII